MLIIGITPNQDCIEQLIFFLLFVGIHPFCQKILDYTFIWKIFLRYKIFSLLDFLPIKQWKVFYLKPCVLPSYSMNNHYNLFINLTSNPRISNKLQQLFWSLYENDFYQSVGGTISLLLKKVQVKGKKHIVSLSFVLPYSSSEKHIAFTSPDVKI